VIYLHAAVEVFGWLTLVAVAGLWLDRYTGRPKWTPDVYRPDQERNA